MTEDTIHHVTGDKMLYVDSIECWNTGGNIYVDVITLTNGERISISDEVIKVFVPVNPDTDYTPDEFDKQETIYRTTANTKKIVVCPVCNSELIYAQRLIVHTDHVTEWHLNTPTGVPEYMDLSDGYWEDDAYPSTDKLLPYICMSCSVEFKSPAVLVVNAMEAKNEDQK